MAQLLAKEAGKHLRPYRNAVKIIGLICDLAPDPTQALKEVWERGWIRLMFSAKETSQACEQIKAMFKSY